LLTDMTILIIEDEPLAAQRLEKLIQELMPEATIAGRLDSVVRAVAWLQQHTPDLILMDIQLADGISFSIFEQCEVRSPVIFTTAYDAYALKAFKVNSIDYILKPVDRDEFGAALAKFRSRQAQPADAGALLRHIGQAMHMLTRRYKTRFVTKVGEHLKTIETENILYFYSQEKTTFCHTHDGRSHILDQTLDEVEEAIDPAGFFRVNRKYLVSTASITDIISFTNSRLRLDIRGSQDRDIIVARERVQDFKAWLDV
jgi:DNA-binding LytR/AlgR family response regulator